MHRTCAGVRARVLRYVFVVVLLYVLVVVRIGVSDCAYACLSGPLLTGPQPPVVRCFPGDLRSRFLKTGTPSPTPMVNAEGSPSSRRKLPSRPSTPQMACP